MRNLGGWLGVLLLLACAVRAQQTANPPAGGSDTSALEQKIRDLEDRLVMLEGQVRQLKAQGATAPSQNATAAATPASEPVSQGQGTTPPGAAGYTAGAADNVRLGGAGGAAAKALNPVISVIGDFIGGAGHNPLNPTPPFKMPESEIGLKPIVLPSPPTPPFFSFSFTQF